MEHYKTSKPLNDSTVSKFVTKQWIKANDLSSGHFSVDKSIKFKTSMPRSNMCDYNDAFIAEKGRISATGNNAAQEEVKS